MQSALRRGKSGLAFASHPVHGEQHPRAQPIAFIAWRKSGLGRIGCACADKQLDCGFALQLGG